MLLEKNHVSKRKTRFFHSRMWWFCSGEIDEATHAWVSFACLARLGIVQAKPLEDRVAAPQIAGNLPIALSAA